MVIVGHSDLNDSNWNRNWVVDFVVIALVNYLNCVVIVMGKSRVVIFVQDQLNHH